MAVRVSWLLGAFGGALALLLALHAAPGLATEPVQPGSVIISEVAWSGTVAGATFEWIELYNTTGTAMDLAGWSLTDDGLLASLTGVIEANDFYLLERSELALIDIEADHFLTGLLQDGGESILLLDPGSGVVDSANQAGGPWPAGTVDEQFRSMERSHPLADDEAQYWESNDGLTRNGLDANGNPVNGTPRQPNSGWAAPTLPNLVLNKSGPGRAIPGDTIQYALEVSNEGQAVATSVVLTDTLPITALYLADDSHYPLSQPSPGTLVWSIGTVAADQSFSINVSVTLASNSVGQITNRAEVSTALTETTLQDNTSEFGTLIESTEPSLLIDAVHYDGYEKWDRDEAVRLINVGGSTQDLGGWRLSDGVSVVVFSDGTDLAPGEGIWIADQASSFRRHFGENPDYEVEGSDPDVPNLTGVWPGFSNDGDEVLLRSDAGDFIDVLVYEAGNVDQPGWSGPAVRPYTVGSVFAAEGQILYRRMGEVSGMRVPDTDTAQDWAQYEHDTINGRRVRYPGWDLEQFYAGQWLTETAEFVIGIAPDNAYDLIRSEISGASSDIQIASLTFRSGAIAEELVVALDRGVEVTVLLEGGPVGGIDDAERHVCQQLEEAGGQCWFMVNDTDGDGDDVSPIHDRYRYMHAKYFIIDRRRVVISTENLSPDSLPNDDKNDGTWGRRGVVLVTDAPAAVNRLRAIWESDFDPLSHRDLLRWDADDSNYGSPGLGSRPITLSGGVSYPVSFLEPTVLSGTFSYGIVQSPENGLADPAGLLHLLARAGQGDTILVEQLREKPHWGSSGSNSIDDPNPRLEALIDAARRGATVSLLLDSFFDDGRKPDSNRATCILVEATALAENLDLRCALANRTGLGLHNKMILAQIDGKGYVFVGSINGTELSNKGNREIALLLQSDEVYDLLADMFSHDWPYAVILPLVYKDFLGRADHLLISEVLYDPPGTDDAEFIELYNPTVWSISLSGYSLGDALRRSDFEDVRRFPNGSYMGPDSTIVVASAATAFRSRFGFDPDFEILNSDPGVPNLVDDPNWGDPAAFLQLGNSGDEVILRDQTGKIIEAIAYGAGKVPGNASCPLVTLSGASLERYPPWRDTDDCSRDFREWPFPNPGAVP